MKKAKQYPDCANFINGVFESTKESMEVVCPLNGKRLCNVALSSEANVETAVGFAENALDEWKGRTIKARASIMYKVHALINEHAQELAELIVAENGKV